VLLAACGADGGDPLSVAGTFWEAARAGQSDRVRELASATTATGLLPGGRARFDDLVLTNAEIEGPAAVVRTAMTLRNADGRTLRITFPTHLVREDGAWKVAVDETMSAAVWSAHTAAMTDSTTRSDTLVARDTAR
jgi:hypothetical protein